jgi:hypothetical protein
MTVTEILRNFQGLLSSTIPFLLRVEIEVGDDAWDDFVERAFEVAVARPLEIHHAVHLRWAYGTWASPGDSSQVMASMAGRTSALVGRAALRDGALEVAYAEQIVDSQVTFAFREFGNPLMTDPINAVKYLTGEVVEEDQTFEKGVRICVPFELCTFHIA